MDQLAFVRQKPHQVAGGPIALFSHEVGSCQTRTQSPCMTFGRFEETGMFDGMPLCIYCCPLPPPTSVEDFFTPGPLARQQTAFWHITNHNRQTSSSDFPTLHKIKMIPTIFEHLLSCRNCNSAVLVEDPSATRSTAATVTGDLVGLVIRHGTTESAGSVSGLKVFPFAAADPAQQWGAQDSSTTSRQVIYMEDCATPACRRQISQAWGLKWLDFEQHFETIAAWSSSKVVGECPCKCHHWDGGADNSECISIDTTLALVGQQSDRYKKPKGPETEHATYDPADLPSELRGRAQSEQIPQIDLFILSWREQCRRDSH